MKKMKNLEYIVSAVIGTFFSFFGVLAIPLTILVSCNVIEYFTCLRVIKMRGEKITKEIIVNGICKKGTMYVLIFVGFGIDCMISYVTDTFHIDIPFSVLFSAIVASWLVINELTSITENCEEMGTRIPILGSVLKFVKRKIETAVDMEDDSTEE